MLHNGLPLRRGGQICPLHNWSDTSRAPIHWTGESYYGLKLEPFAPPVKSWCES